MGAADSAALSGWQLYWLGVSGAFIAAILVYVVPPLVAAQRSGSVGDWDRTKAVLTLALIVLLSLLGGAGPFVLADGQAETTGQAITAGLQAQAVLKALVAAGGEATAAPRS
ncbi:MAG: hypothetical protein M3134_07200 [Actinomycetota bacterium]|nr:hypothetical protein [Actinomycetota bacterium]